MPEPRDLPLARGGEALRRDRAGRRRFRVRLALAPGIGLLTGALVAVAAAPPPPLLVWNASASAPRGVYLIDAGAAPARGDMAVAWPPRAARRLAAERHYLPANVPLVKRVAAARGDRVCAAGGAVFVNGALIARRRDTDPSGRALPTWAGCFRLGEDRLLLLMPGRESFDGRYFGPTARRDVIGPARLIWAR